jgi:NAD(P)-dependent dehydrogenase (short-subunit alcohol dehydrogenase family)
MTLQAGGIAVITGAASGFGLEASKRAAQRGMKIVMADVQADALAAAQAQIEAEFGWAGVEVLPFRLDVSKAAEVQALADATFGRFGVPNFVFNNAGVGAGGLIWEHTRPTGSG